MQAAQEKYKHVCKEIFGAVSCHATDSQAHIPQPLFHSMCKIWIASRGFIGLRQQLKIDGAHVGET